MPMDVQRYCSLEAQHWDIIMWGWCALCGMKDCCRESSAEPLLDHSSQPSSGEATVHIDND